MSSGGAAMMLLSSSLKRGGFRWRCFHQGIERLALTDDVYVAVPAGGKGRALRNNVKLARRLGLGVLTVRLRRRVCRGIGRPRTLCCTQTEEEKEIAAAGV